MFTSKVTFNITRAASGGEATGSIYALPFFSTPRIDVVSKCGNPFAVGRCRMMDLCALASPVFLTRARKRTRARERRRHVSPPKNNSSLRTILRRLRLLTRTWKEAEKELSFPLSFFLNTGRERASGEKWGIDPPCLLALSFELSPIYGYFISLARVRSQSHVDAARDRAVEKCTPSMPGLPPRYFSCTRDNRTSTRLCVCVWIGVGEFNGCGAKVSF